MNVPRLFGNRVKVFVPEVRAFGGVERLVVGLAGYLSQVGIGCEIGCFHDSIGLAKYSAVPVTTVLLNPRRNVWAEARALRRYLGDAPGGSAPLIFDLKGGFAAGMAGVSGYHLHFTDPPSLLPSDLTKFAFSVGRLHEGSFPSLLTRARAEIAHRETRRGVGNARSVIVMTNRIAAELQQRYGRSAVVIRPGAHHVDRVVPHGSARRRSILSISRLERNKRIEWSIIAMEELVAIDPAWHLDVVGSGNYRHSLEALVTERGLEDHVRFHGRVSDEALANLSAEASLFAMPASQGYGLPALEALRCGVPVVMHGDSGVSEVLCDSPWVEIVEGDAAAFASGIRRLADRVESGTLTADCFPSFPSEDEWAANIARHCGWID
ncbi:glycosyltransferase family 4 protein [Sphingomonas sp. AR_OL41]|uniref:glycosyltransferase family 4 protein n=1 Tax=Sphingomonas sp. AR_OL41 TaxID=3042729 RepID=UPI00248150D8|nr:glycosyltransferase family 4 protein [Sphingomonas sp. AR_OL41]MDH7972901.1 glycosyltransferase family 4 protein [Sphingomonas sp. AR_OL41]